MLKLTQLISVFCAVFLLTQCRVSINYHDVEEGQLYRSAQLTGEEFQETIEEYGIKTIINLRGANPGSDWYEEEVAVAARNNVRLINISMSAKRLPHKEDLIKLLNAFDHAERPILMHCQGGADRTGEASAIYLMSYMNKSKEEALDMLTPKYLHFKSKFPAKRYLINLYQGLDWARNEYDPCESDYLYYSKEVFCGSEGEKKRKELPSEEEDT